MFTSQDLLQMQQLGISAEKANMQIDNFKKGFPFLKVIAPATPAKGIMQLSEQDIKHYEARFDAFTGTLLKFTPASGAASRMFKALFEAMDVLASDTPLDWTNKTLKPAKEFFDNLARFAFYGQLARKVKEKGGDITRLATRQDYLLVLQSLLNEDGLNYGGLPKGLLTFHTCPDGVRTALEEHLVEAALYARDTNNTAYLHFTVSPEHRALFEELVEQVLPLYEDIYEIDYRISFSEQKKSTDTIAVDMHNHPFRNADGSLLFRPAGHGALIANLAELEADIIFIKNIDNVVPDQLKPDTVTYKKALAGVLLQVQERLFQYMDQLAEGCTPRLCTEIQEYYEKQLAFVFPKGWEHNQEGYLMQLLNRPIRVCGMVRNVGEPGGGPFVAVNPDGSASLQIAESSQLHLADPAVKALFDASTHFNPVDLVCSFVKHSGECFYLQNFVDPSTGFISTKSKDGKELKAQELPGLWNGAMSNWNTIFVEVPLITFNPVKTVNDLLRPEHQGQE